MALQQPVGRQEHYFTLHYQNAQAGGAGIDFGQLKRADYRKDPLVLISTATGQQIGLPNLTNRRILHLIKAGEKQNCRPSFGGWWNIFFGIPFLIGLCQWHSRYKEVHSSTKQILEAVLGSDAPGLGKLLDPKQGDPQLARLLVRALLHNQDRISQEEAKLVVGHWSEGKLASLSLPPIAQGSIQRQLQATTGKDSPGVQAMRALVVAVQPPPRSESLPPALGEILAAMGRPDEVREDRFSEFTGHPKLNFGTATSEQLIAAFNAAVGKMEENSRGIDGAQQATAHSIADEIVATMRIVLSRPDYQRLANPALSEVLLKALEASAVNTNPNGDYEPAFGLITMVADNVEPASASPGLKEAAVIALTTAVNSRSQDTKRAAAVKLLALITANYAPSRPQVREWVMEALTAIQADGNLAELHGQAGELIILIQRN